MLSSYLAIGALAGISSGLLGIGGGIIIVPALSAIFSQNTDIPAHYAMHLAIGTSLATMIATLASGVYAHHRQGTVHWPLAKSIFPGLVAGTVLGAFIAAFLPARFLTIFFSVFLIIVSLRMLFQRKDGVEMEISNQLRQMIAGIIGVLSGILGAGGGSLMVPFLLRCRLKMNEATGTSLACGFVVSLIATICFMLSGLFTAVKLPDSTGYIYWPAFFGLVTASVLFAPVGAMLANKLPTELLKRIFAIFLLCVAADMVFFSR
jgi:uncharacterized membrane protein YfcA